MGLEAPERSNWSLNSLKLERDVEPGLGLGFSLLDDCEKVSPTAWPSLWVRNRGKEVLFERKGCKSLPAEAEQCVPASLRGAWEPEQGWDYSHTCCTHHLHHSATWCCTGCDSSR